LVQLIFDQGLRARRGVNRCSQAVASSPFFWLSIQPQVSAPSSAWA
jgi:hypothetical protein